MKKAFYSWLHTVGLLVLLWHSLACLFREAPVLKFNQIRCWLAPSAMLPELGSELITMIAMFGQPRTWLSVVWGCQPRLGRLNQLGYVWTIQAGYIPALTEVKRQKALSTWFFMIEPFKSLYHFVKSHPFVIYSTTYRQGCINTQGMALSYWKVTIIRPKR